MRREEIELAARDGAWLVYGTGSTRRLVQCIRLHMPDRCDVESSNFSYCNVPHRTLRVASAQDLLELS